MSNGRWIFWPRIPHPHPHVENRYLTADPTTTQHGPWARIATLIGTRPRTLWITVSLLLAAMTLGLGSLKPHGLSDAGQFVDKPDSITGAQTLTRHFPAGTGAPAIIIGNTTTTDQLTTTISSVDGVADLSAPTHAGNLVQYQATLSAAADTPAAKQTVHRLRTAVHAIPGASAKVGGTTAIAMDTNNAAQRDNLVIIPIVLAVILLILIMLLRAVVAPLLMMATVVLSFTAALGASALTFQHLFGFEGTDAGFPLLAFIFLVALGVDYNIFLMHRVREETHQHGTHTGILRGLTVTGGVITSAGLVLAATFAALATLPLVGMAEMGFVVAFGVLLDSIIVRSLLLPALAHDIGPRIWAPSHLAHTQHAQTPNDPKVLEPIS